MSAAASAAFAGEGDDRAVAYPQDRQLRLVFEVGYAPPVGMSSGPADSLVAAGPISLAAYALSLRRGERCFCCGHPLEVVESVGEGGSGRCLECPACGASLLGPE